MVGWPQLAKKGNDRRCAYAKVGLSLTTLRRLLFPLLSGKYNRGWVSEVVGIQTSNIDPKRQLIKVWDEKKDTWRDIVVTKSTLQLILMHLNAKPMQTPTLFDFSYKTANRRLRKWCLKANIGIRKAHWHTLRHTYIMQSRLKGRDIKVVQQQTGDSLLTLLRVYSNLSVEDRVRISENKPIIPKKIGDVK